jgi:hypothetical protein
MTPRRMKYWEFPIMVIFFPRRLIQASRQENNHDWEFPVFSSSSSALIFLAELRAAKKIELHGHTGVFLSGLYNGI